VPLISDVLPLEPPSRQSSLGRLRGSNFSKTGHCKAELLTIQQYSNRFYGLPMSKQFSEDECAELYQTWRRHRLINAFAFLLAVQTF